MKSQTIINFETQLDSIKKDIVKSYEPSQKNGIYNGDIQNKKYQEQIQAAAKIADNRFFELSFQIDKATRDNQQKISQALYPMFFGNYSADRSRGESNRLYAIEFVKGLKTAEQFRKQYLETMNLSDVDLATRLLDQAELKWSEYPNEKALLEELKRSHVESLQLNDLLVERAQLNDLKKLFDRTKKMWSAGLFEPNAKENRDSYTKKMIAAEIAI